MSEIDLTPEAMDRLIVPLGMIHEWKIGNEAAATLRALSARLAEVEAKLDSTLKDRAFILRERDATFALMLARAEAAEAKVARAAAILRLCLKYNTAMHSGAAEHNKKIKSALEELDKP